MYTATILGKSLSREEKVVRITVKFDNGASSFTKDLEFGLNFEKTQLEIELKRIIQNLELAETKLTDVSEGLVDLSLVTAGTQTTAEIDRDKWFRQIQKLRALQELKTLGGMPVAWQTDLDTLITKVQTDAKKSYLTDM